MNLKKNHSRPINLKRRVVMRKGLLLCVFSTFILCWTLSYSAEMQKPIKILPSTPSATPASKTVAPAPSKLAPTTPPPSPLSILNITVPNGGENWVIGTQHDITWTRSNDINGYITIDLYRGGTIAPNKVGTIASGISVSSGRYVWTVGSIQGGTAAVGGDYRVVISAGGKTDASNGSFNIMAKIDPAPSVPLASGGQAMAKVTPSPAMKMVSLTYPRRADLLHKGITYKITWKSLNLSNSMMKIELLNNQETTVVSPIAYEIYNNGQFEWSVPTNLPDQEAFYKMRIQTIDGAHKDIAGPFKIAKATGPSAGPSLKVTNPLSGDRAIGDTVPVKWTSAVSCSGNGGPLDDGFRIELMQGTNKIADLTDTGYTFDSEVPGGYVNWRWDWRMVRGSINPGTYSIRITSMISPSACKGTSPTFRVYDPLPATQGPPPATDSVLLNAQYTNRKHCYAEVYTSGNTEPSCPDYPDVPAGQGQVGSVSNYAPLGGSIMADEHMVDYTHFRSKVYFPVDQVSMQNRKLKYANLEIKVTMKKSSGQGLNYEFCAYSLHRLNGVWNNCMDMPVDPGEILVPNNRSLIDINVTSLVGEWLTGAKPNNGFLLIDLSLWPADGGNRRNACWTYYTATLYLEFDKVLDILTGPKIPIPGKK
jgi:hypothetical protein